MNVEASALAFERSFDRQIVITGPGYVRQPASIACHSRDWNEGGRRHTECSIHLVSDGFDITGVDFDFFQAFCKIREQLAERDFYPLCYGASRNIVLTGMLRDCSLGLQAYKLPMAERAGNATSGPDEQRRRLERVCIFDTDPDVQVSTVAAQEAFWRERR